MLPNNSNRESQEELNESSEPNTIKISSGAEELEEENAEDQSIKTGSGS